MQKTWKIYDKTCLKHGENRITMAGPLKKRWKILRKDSLGPIWTETAIKSHSTVCLIAFVLKKNISESYLKSTKKLAPSVSSDMTGRATWSISFMPLFPSIDLLAWNWSLNESTGVPSLFGFLESGKANRGFLSDVFLLTYRLGFAIWDFFQGKRLSKSLK